MPALCLCLVFSETKGTFLTGPSHRKLPFAVHYFILNLRLLSFVGDPQQAASEAPLYKLLFLR